ncbi:AraC family transcriptional regulator [Bernardetia sp. ABR2-2B]|uniref:helix-turn-helix domain-containing protein n=1 Tax=Bernardetia sp. ABR2-2B TaxID=3127472 RepID=UPI0030CB8E97
MSITLSESTTYQSNRTALSIFNYSDKNKTSSTHSVSALKPKTIQTGKVTLVVVLEGTVSFESKEYKQSCTIGESLIIPPHKAVRLEALQLEEKPNKKNTKTKKNGLSWLELEVPIEIINLTISQYNKIGVTEDDCKLRVENNSVWQFGETPINVTHDTTIKKAITRLIDLFTEEHYNKDVFIDFAIRELILRFVRTPSRDRIDLEKNDESENETNPSIEAVLGYIKEHIDEPISIDTLTDIASMSKAAFFRTFKETLDISPIDYINRERVEIAKNRLVDISKSVTDICYELGYNHMTYFIRVFKKYEGITPKQFQMKQNKENIKSEQNEKDNNSEEEK